MTVLDATEAARKFVLKWSAAELSERAASQEHFIDLCRLLGQPTPAEADPTGEDYAFEKPVKVVQAASKGSKGESGFVDVWKRGYFAWEYKRKDKYKTLDEAYRQLYQYRDALDNPPLSVVCDIRTTEIRTHFPGYPTEKIVIHLEEIPGRLEVLRRVFTSPETFRPAKTRQQVTQDLANEFADLADRLIDRYPPDSLHLFQSPGSPVAHFLMKVMFCLFAEDIGLLPDNAFTKLVDRALFAPETFLDRATTLFGLMRTGGEFGNDLIPYFNGGLFDDAAPLPLLHGDLLALRKAASRDWSGVEPSIFGTLFERILDPAKRAQIGAHYTSKEDILLVVEPVVMLPLRRKWSALQEQLAAALEEYDRESDRKKRGVLAAPIIVQLDQFRRHLGAQRILDPACGSGNFLYVALQQLLDLDDEVVRFAARRDISISPVPYIRPAQLHGIEINPYAAELAQVVIWIGYLQWMQDHGIDVPNRPILDSLHNIENRDAILDLSDKNHPKPAEWPEADYIIGNPPFLGASLLRQQLGNEYAVKLYKTFDIPKTSDLCCYWFVQALDRVSRGGGARAGLLATQGIRGPQNREALRRVNVNSRIFNAWSDRDWVLDGAMVHVSIICFSRDEEREFRLDGVTVDEIHSDLSSGQNVTGIARLRENEGIGFFGDTKKGRFDIPWEEARGLIAAGGNPNGKGNFDVVRPWMNGIDLNSRARGMWIIDFPTSSTEAQAAEYQAPFEHIARAVKPAREDVRNNLERTRWWLHARPAPDLRQAIENLPRFIGTCRVAKHRIFCFIPSIVLPDGQIIAFARSDNYFLGILHSAMHEIWSRRTGTQLREAESGFRYRVSSCFETFPLPWKPGSEPQAHQRYRAIADAASSIDQSRERWLNPPEWIEPIAKRIDENDDFSDVPAEARPLVRQSAIMAAAAKDPRLKKRTLTNLYNERPAWLRLAHEALDRAVLAAYAATDPEGGWDESWAQVWTDSGAGQPLPKNHPLSEKRREVDQRVLANLLRLNQLRAK